MRSRAADHSMSVFDLRDALAQPGCPVCRLKIDAADRFLGGLLWESVNDPAKRQEIRRARGFCYEHFWALVRVGASLGVAIIARDVLQNLLEILESAAFEPLPVLSLRRVHETLDSSRASAATAEPVARLETEGPCPACVWADKMERIYLDALVRNLVGEDGLLAGYEASDGLCLPHLRRALARVREEETFGALLDAQRSVWGRLVAHLSESIRKSDYHHSDEAWGEEAGAWLRAVAALVGARPADKGRRKSPLAVSGGRIKVDTVEK